MGAPGDPGATGGPEARGRDLAQAAEITSVDRQRRTTVEMAPASPTAWERSYTIVTTAVLHDGRPSRRTVIEGTDGPLLRTRSPVLDAFHAMAVEEAREASVDVIRDGAFDQGRPFACPPGGCFETGKLWPYVWTRDTAFAVRLGLAALDPTRARNSLELKLSERRGSGELQVVQDTGSGGSYPISTDRVVWALGARSLAFTLDGAERAAFVTRAAAALAGTVDQDRRAVFDPDDGLYRGETSFLDWREQSYPAWTAEDTVHLGMSKALSTNVLHLAALETAAWLAAATGRPDRAERYQGWAAALRPTIHARFWSADAGLWSSFTSTGLDPAPVRRYDLLGVALAILHGLGTPEEGRRALARYPHLPEGAPVVWPQQRRVPVYHNRAIWPFVTAFALEAGRQVGHHQAAERALGTLLRAAMLHVSHLENVEALSGADWVEAGPCSGPVVNSPRQLWSVAAAFAAVHRVIFGLDAGPDGLSVVPYVTRGMRRELFAGAETLVLARYPYRGRRLTITLELPPAGPGEGAYRLGRVLVDGLPVPVGPIAPARLGSDSRIEVELVDEPPPAGPSRAATLTVVDPDDRRRVYGPEPPGAVRVGAAATAGSAATTTVGAAAATAGSAAATAGSADRLALAWSPPEGEVAAELGYRIYRDGVLVAAAVPGTATTWVDPDPGATTVGPSHCYAIEALYQASGNTSQRSRPACFWGVDDRRIQVYSGPALIRAGEAIVVRSVRAAASGAHLVEVVAANPGPHHTGVTCAVKRLTVVCEASGAVVAQGFVALPHTGHGDGATARGSSLLLAHLEASHSYRIVLDEDPLGGPVNMSAFRHFERYTGGRGGRAGAENRADVQEIRLYARQG